MLLLLLLLLLALLFVDLASLLNDQRGASLKSLGVSHGEHHTQLTAAAACSRRVCVGNAHSSSRATSFASAELCAIA
jgi:hypothetical protein